MSKKSNRRVAGSRPVASLHGYKQSMLPSGCVLKFKPRNLVRTANGFAFRGKRGAA